ncbi:MAG: DUF2891 domain-containing protein [Planctomycetales bacterium]|nr:DUF2891 domain-containing protein [Planctomycetales bacterium]
MNSVSDGRRPTLTDFRFASDARHGGSLGGYARLGRSLVALMSALLAGGVLVQGTIAQELGVPVAVTVAISQPTQEGLAMLDESGGLTSEAYEMLASLVLSGIDREYPNKPSNTLASDADARPPRELYPAFHGCFDWHSSVHGHWVLVRLLKLDPDHARATEIRAALDRHLTEENLRGEVEFFSTPANKSFERMYGWAWFLRLAMELHTWEDEQGQRWRDSLRPLELLLVERTADYLNRLQFPIRTGVHPNTAFALGQILDYARAVNRPDLADQIVARSKDYFLADRDYPDAYEPSGEDFFSAGLCEADLMRRVLEPDAFAEWLDRFLPGLGGGKESPMWEPVEVSDVTDGKIVHLAGLDLSRAWCLQGVADALPKEDPRRASLEELAREHLITGLAYVASGHYEGEHWLGTFALYTLTNVGTTQDPLGP